MTGSTYASRFPRTGTGFAWDEHDGVPALRAATDGTHAVFTTRIGGVSAPPYDSLNLNFSRDAGHGEHAAVAENRRRAGATIGSGGQWSRVRQVHGADVVRAGDGEPQADGLWTDDPSRTIAVLGADCMLVVVQGGLGVAAVHAGWAGTLAGVIEAGMRAVAGTHVWVGPSIGPCCYDVDPARQDAFRSSFGGEVLNGGLLDLWTAAEIAAARGGASTVHVARLCTRCDPELFFSYRRDGTPRGAQGAIARLAT